MELTDETSTDKCSHFGTVPIVCVWRTDGQRIVRAYSSRRNKMKWQF